MYLGMAALQSYSQFGCKVVLFIWPKYAWCGRSLREFPLLFTLQIPLLFFTTNNALCT